MVFVGVNTVQLGNRFLVWMRISAELPLKRSIDLSVLVCKYAR